MEKEAPITVVEASITVVDVDDGDNFDDVFDEEDMFVDEEEDIFVERVCRCEGPCPHKE